MNGTGIGTSTTGKPRSSAEARNAVVSGGTNMSLRHSQAGDAGVVKTLQVGALGGRAARQRHARRHDHLGSEQPRRRVLELADVRPRHPARRPRLAGHQA